MLNKLLLYAPCRLELRSAVAVVSRLRSGASFPSRGSRGPVLWVLLTPSRQCTTAASSSKIRSRSDISRLLSYAGPERRILLAAVGLLSLSSLATIVFPFFIGKTIDTIYQSDSIETMKKRLNYIVTIVGGLAVLGGAANFGRVYLINVASQRITNRVQAQAHRAIIRQETAFFDTQQTGQLLSRLSSDAAQVGNSLTQNASDGLRSLFSITGAIGMMTYTSPQLSLVGLGVVSPVALISMLYARKLKSVATNVQNRLANSAGVAEEQFANIRTVRMFSKERLEIERYAKTLETTLIARTEEAKKRAIFFGTTGASGNVMIMSVLYYGGMLMADGRISVGSLSSFLIYAAYVGISISSIFNVVSEMVKALGASQKLFALMDRQPSVPLDVGKCLACVEGRIDFQRVDFRYPTRDANIFNELDLHIPSGKVTAVVGPSGSGKSTLASLILRLYDPNSGAVLLDGHRVAELNPTFLRGQIGVVAQEPVLFSATIRENIEYGSTGPVTIEQVEDAARIANAYNFVNDFPQGFETVVGERGVMLSGGQKQRIAIARAVVRQPRILILDEATSSLDAISERIMQDVLERFSQGRTVIVIAHRLSTIRRADNIVVLKAGRIVEQGQFHDLLRIEGGMFNNLVTHQVQG
ncbi:ATP-binding cassette sub-family B member 10 [Tropilaelaps mercedesae]|uniref:ATP-binding cassette sub-family B member 10 n=1 Tax=Tropilaelaps mercedesae TaxID=418985 RepID=A0A1V9XNY4_9ACAR|nr:ATP-binding cassette sub-family B member 10 [Tropilaelaps mercedesae]